jgi:hypothetical protein
MTKEYSAYNFVDFVPSSQMKMHNDDVILHQVPIHIPDLYDTDHTMMDDKTVYLHYRCEKSNYDCYVFEYGGFNMFFAYCTFHDGFGEMGYQSLREIRLVDGMELDLDWELKTLGDVKRQFAAANKQF